MGTRKQAAGLVTLAAAVGLVIGTNRDEVAVLLGPTVQGIGKAAGAAYGGALRFVLQQKEALEDKVAEAKVNAAAQEE